MMKQLTKGKKKMKNTRLMENKAKRFFLLIALFFVSVLYCAAQNASQQNRMAILSFNGGTPDERDGIAELFSFTPQIMQNFTVIPRTNITNAIRSEQSFQLSGMTDADTMARLGNQFGANYVMAGSITSLGSSNLLIVTVVKIDVIQQVAGDFVVYNTLDDLVKNPAIIQRMAENLISLMRKDTGKLQRLAVVPVQFSGGVNEADGDALAQLLAIHLLRAGKFAVYPRTQSLEQVQREYSTQLSGVTRDSQAVALGRGTNPEYVLSIASRRIGSTNMFNAAVIDLEGGQQINGVNEQYANLSDGIDAMEFLARQLSGVQVSDRERSRRTANVTSVAGAEERAAARKEAGEKFASKSAFLLDGWFGFQMHSTDSTDSDESTSSTDTTGYSGGLFLGMRYGWIGLQTGINFMGTNFMVPVAGVNENISSLVFQLPVLIRARISFLGDLMYISPYAGVGINLAASSKNVIEVTSQSMLSFLGGLDIGMNLMSMGVYVGFQYNGDLSNNEILYKGTGYEGKNSLFIITAGVSLNIPFRKKSIGGANER